MSLPKIAPYALDAELPINRTQWTLEPGRTAFLVHDMQAHFIDAFTRVPGAQIDRAVHGIGLLLDAARDAQVPTIYTAQPPRQHQADRQLLTDFWGPGLSTDAAAQIIGELTPRAGETILTKWRYSAFHRTDLLDRLRNHGRDQLIITGVYSHIGCLTTALDAFMYGIQPFFVADAQADFSAQDQEMALRYVASRCGQVTTTAATLDALGGAFQSHGRTVAQDAGWSASSSSDQLYSADVRA